MPASNISPWRPTRAACGSTAGSRSIIRAWASARCKSCCARAGARRWRPGEDRHAGHSRPGGAVSADECRRQGLFARPVSGTELKHADDAALLSRMLLHEDDKVFVLITQAAGPGRPGRVGRGASHRQDARSLDQQAGREAAPGVHRLDRDTSGRLVIARSRSAAQALAEAFRERDTKKTYWALVKRRCRGRPRARSRPGSSRNRRRTATGCGSPSMARTAPDNAFPITG